MGAPPTFNSCAKRVVAHRGIEHVRRTVPHSPVRVRGAGWERRGKAFYYYRMTRIGGKPRRVYVGSGRLGRLHELLDRRDERVRLAVRAARDREQKQLAEADHRRVEVLHLARLIFDAQMVATGHYLHGGQWRRVLGRPKTRQYRREEHEIEESTGDQVDEVWGYVFCKEKKRERKYTEQDGIGDAYCFIGMERTTNLILAWHLGRRTTEDTHEFAHKLAFATSGHFQVTTDGFRPYQTAIPSILTNAFSKKWDNHRASDGRVFVAELRVIQNGTRRRTRASKRLRSGL